MSEITINGITIVIPNLNQGRRLKETLDAFNNQSSVRPLEIIVVDNGSNDGSQELIRSFENVRLEILKEPKNPYVARNAGMRLATYDWILLNDATCTPQPGYLKALVEIQEHDQADLVIGNIEFDLSSKPSLGEIVDSLHFMRNYEYRDVRKTYPTGTLFFRKSILKEIGFFREDMQSGPDYLWTRKVHERGGKVSFARKAQVLYPGTAFPALFKKAYRDGWGHGTMARENGSFHWPDALWRLRPPGPKYLRYVLNTRGRPEFRSRLVSIWLGLWLYRIVYNIGRLHIGRG